jgi:hypothetical protein
MRVIHPSTREAVCDKGNSCPAAPRLIALSVLTATLARICLRPGVPKARRITAGEKHRHRRARASNSFTPSRVEPYRVLHFQPWTLVGWLVRFYRGGFLDYM